MEKINKQNWVDGNNNWWSSKKYTEEEAETASQNFADCQHLINCVNCVNCAFCDNSTNLKDCEECEDCQDLEDCYGVRNLRGLKGVKTPFLGIPGTRSYFPIKEGQIFHIYQLLGEYSGYKWYCCLSSILESKRMSIQNEDGGEPYIRDNPDISFDFVDGKNEVEELCKAYNSVHICDPIAKEALMKLNKIKIVITKVHRFHPKGSTL